MVCRQQAGVTRIEMVGQGHQGVNPILWRVLLKLKSWHEKIFQLMQIQTQQTVVTGDIIKIELDYRVKKRNCYVQELVAQRKNKQKVNTQSRRCV